MALDPLKFAVAIQDEATAKLEKIQSDLEKLKDKTITVNVTGLSDLQNLLSALQHQQLNNLGKEVSIGLKDAAEGLKREAQDAVRESLGKLAEDLVSVKTAIQHDNFTAFSERIIKCAEAVDRLDSAFKRFHVTIGQDEGMRNFMSGLGEVIRNVRSTLGTIELGKNGGIKSFADNYERNVQRIESAMHRLRESSLVLGSKLGQAKAFGIGVDNRYIYTLDAYMRKLEQLRRDEEVMHGKGWHADNAYKDLLRNVEHYIKYLDKQMNAMSRNAKEKEKSAQHAARLTSEEQRLAKALQQGTHAASGQSQVLGDLRNMMMQYLSVYGAKQFLTEMANITGELELQKRSLEVIIGSAQTADQLFGEIRDLSQMSPYTFQDLLKSTRQLAAFGIETKDLFGTMRALSDIGAGLNVDVQRLILAYGHTRSYGYLSGIQNRQFETAGIDMVGALADRYNRLADAEERAGKAAEHVTRKDIFKKMSKREISFADVNAVIMDLDRPGGKFYNMQERQFDTLGGKLRNLRNNYNIMMAEMGGSNKGFLMGSVNMLNELTEHWDKYARVLASVLVPLGMYKVATLAVNGAIGQQSDLMYRNMIALLRNQRATQNAASMMTGGYWNAIRTGYSSQGSFKPTLTDAKAFYRTVQSGFQSGSINKSQLMMMGTSNELPTLYKKIALSIAGVDKAQISAIASATGWQRASLRLKYSLGVAAGAVRAFGAALSSMMIQLAPMAVIGGITALWSHFHSMSEETKSALDNLAHSAKEDAKSINDVIERYTSRGVAQTGDTSYINGERIIDVGLVFDMSKISSMTKSDMEQLKLELQKYSPFYEGDLVDIGKMESQAEQVMAIMRKLDSYRHSAQVLSATADNHTEAAGGKFWSWSPHESFVVNLEDMAKVFKQATSQVDKYTEEQIDEFDKAMGGALSRMVKSGAANDQAEALKKVLINSLSLSGEEKNKLVKSWDNDELSALFKRYQVFAKNRHTQTGMARAYRKDYEQSVKRLSDSLRMDINKNFSRDDIDGALKYAIDAYETFASEAKGVSEEVKQYGLEMVLKSVFGEGSKHGAAYNEMQNKLFSAEAFSEISRLYNFDVLTPRNEIVEGVYDVISKIKERWSAGGKDLTVITKETISSIVNTLVNDNRLETEWQKKFAFGSDGNASAFGKLYHKQIKDAKDYYLFWFDDMKKVYDDVTKNLKQMFVPLKQKWDIDIDPNITFLTKDLDKLIKLRDEVKKKVDDSVTDVATKEKLQPILKELDGYVTMATVMKEEGIELGTEKKTHGKGTYKDKESEVWEQRIKLIQEARREYDYWEKKIGKDAAQEKVKGQFSNLTGVDKILQPGDLDNLATYEQTLRRIEKEIESRYAKDKKLPAGQKRDTNIANDIKNLRELNNALYNISKIRFEKSSDVYLSGLTQRIEDLTQKWELFNMVRKSTGDVVLAKQAAGIPTSENTSGTVADAMRSELLDQLRAAGGEELVSKLPLDLHLDAEGIKEKLTQAIPMDESVDTIDTYRTKIEGIVKLYQEWQKLQKSVLKDDLQAFSSLIGSAVDLQSEVKRIMDEYKDTIDKISRLRASDKNGQNSASYDRAEKIAAANRDMKLVQATADYKMLMDGVVSMSKQAAEAIKNRYVNELKKSLDAGAISASEYARRIMEINKKMNDLTFSKSDTRSYLEGGLDALFQNKISEGQSLMEQGAFEGNASMQKMGEGMMKFGQQGMAAVGMVDTIVHGINGIVQGLKDTFDELREMFGALGYDTNSDEWEDANAFFTGFSKASASATKAWDSAKSGDAGGVISGVVGSFTGWITSFAQSHDKKLQNKIESLEEKLGEIEANTEVLQTLRNRTLGYDNGGQNIRAGYQQQYWRSDAANVAMRQFYTAKGMSGYEQELDYLKQEREMYLEMYNLENDKKNESQEALTEYKSKIAELDDQIRFFAEDMAKELWDVDFKGWSDQFSDALSSAFENGENMFKSFNDTAKHVMQSVTNEMMKIGLVEPLINRLRNKLFGYTDNNGNFVSGIVSTDDLVSNPDAAAKQVLTEITRYFKPGGEGSNMVQAAKTYLTSVDALMQQLGYSNGLKNDDATTLSASVHGTSEETSDLLAGYVNALRQDVAMNRLLLTELVAQFWPEYNEAFMSQVKAVSRIDGNVQAMMEMMRYGSGALYEEIRSLRSRIDNVVDGSESFAMR